MKGMLRNAICLAIMMPSLCLAERTLPHGLYVGLSTAATTTTIKNSLTFNPAEVEDAAIYNRFQRGTTTHLQPGFLIGYEYLYNCRWLLSAEFQANFLNGYITPGGSDFFSNSIRPGSQYALQARGGFAFTPEDNMVYFIAGVAKTNTHIHLVFNNAIDTVGTLGDLQLRTLSQSENATAFKFGAGYEKHFSPNIGIRFDYTHTNYGTFTNGLNDIVFFDILPNLGESSFKQSTDMLTVTVLFLS